MKTSIVVIAPELGKRYKLTLSKEIYQLITAKHARDYIKRATPEIPEFLLLFNGEYLDDTDKIGYTDGCPIYLKVATNVGASMSHRSPQLVSSRVRSAHNTPGNAARSQRRSLTDVLESFESGNFGIETRPVYEDAEVVQRIQHLKEMQQNIQGRKMNEVPGSFSDMSNVSQRSAVSATVINTPAISDEQIAQAISRKLQIGCSDENIQAGEQNQPVPLTPQTVVQQTPLNNAQNRVQNNPKGSPDDNAPGFHTITLTKRNATPVINKLPPKPQTAAQEVDAVQNEIQRLRDELRTAREQQQQENEAAKTAAAQFYDGVQQKLSQMRQIRSQRESQLSYLSYPGYYSYHGQKNPPEQTSERSSLVLSEVQGGKADNSLSRGSVSSRIPQEGSQSSPRNDSFMNDRLEQLAEQYRKHEQFLRLQEYQQYMDVLARQNADTKTENAALEVYLRFAKHQQEILKYDYLNSNQLKCEVQNEIKLYKQQAKERCLQTDKRDVFEAAILVEKLRQAVTQNDETAAYLAETAATRQALHNYLEDLKGNIRVFVRIRPILRGEQNLCKNIPIKMQDYLTVSEEQEIRLKLPSATTVHGDQAFNFYRVYNGDANYKSVFSDVQPLLLSALDGYNLTILCYGATGSGKTFTLIGDDGEPSELDDAFARLGILPRAVVYLFEQLTSQNSEFYLEAAMLELYCDQLSDMINPGDGDLKIRFQDGYYFVQNLYFRSVASANELIQLIATGLERRHVGSTRLNDRSSRSHAIIYLRITRNNRQSVIIFGDLAGSERVEKSHSEGQRLREAQFINSSLSALGDVVAALARKNQHIPFRNSKITQILQPGLGGNSKCLILINLSPLWQNLHESFNSLVFASQIRQIRNTAVRRIFE